MNPRIDMAAGASEIPAADSRALTRPRPSRAQDPSETRTPAPARRQRGSRRAGGKGHVPRMLNHLKALPTKHQVVHVEPWSKVTLILLERHVAYLDVLSILIRLRTHKALARTELLRAFVEFMERSGIDFTRFATIGEMTRYLAAHFRANNRNRLPLLLESSLFHQEQAAQPEETINVAAT